MCVDRRFSETEKRRRVRKDSLVSVCCLAVAYSETVVDILCAVFSYSDIFQKDLFAEFVSFLLANVKMVSRDCHESFIPALDGGGGRGWGGGGGGREREREEIYKCYHQ